MKLATFVKDGQATPGVVTDDGCALIDIVAGAVTQLGWAPDHLASIQAIVEAGDTALADIREIVRQADVGHLIALDDVRLLAPIPRPVQIRDFLAFEKHMIQAYDGIRKLRASLADDPLAYMAMMERKGILRVPDAWYENPLYYRVNPANVCATDTDVHWPAYSDKMDFEFEFACVVGKGGKDISVADARSHIFGYMIFNDLSARDEQARAMPGQMGPGKGKDFDNSKPMGPFLVTADEIGDPYRLAMTARLNGEVFVTASSSEMNWRFEELIAYISQSETLEPGDIFGSGTVGDGCTIETGHVIADGDVVELEMEKIGVLRTRFLATAREGVRRIAVMPHNVTGGPAVTA
ncbi:fumarylacetoacetate hydrolase family protein [Sphingomonas nostoxanthinifaciens]|uniref:fumarylacetoacetate hydrolase family protein n=1 Tax=Sphingomonas nostoxanthinifaciens TaxID=2872652 RepID=UPI001CC20E02|nr:fumarylacetoacetate hydrolase family protein [Sphingomonas nostoxanthinifaciens]UAK25292.1 fumarylacetoacetate hydrolase family protein [Sphingomonas nostoxanthinifaciens]